MPWPAVALAKRTLQARRRANPRADGPPQNPDGLADLRNELAQVRAELTELRKQHRRVLDLLGVVPPRMGEPWPRYVAIDAESIGLRCTPEHIPIIMRADEEGARMEFFDQERRCRGTLGIDEFGAHFRIRNTERVIVASIEERENGTGGVYVATADGKPRAGLRITEGAGVVTIVDDAGKALAFLRGESEGGACLLRVRRGRPGSRSKPRRAVVS